MTLIPCAKCWESSDYHRNKGGSSFVTSDQTLQPVTSRLDSSTESCASDHSHHEGSQYEPTPPQVLGETWDACEIPPESPIATEGWRTPAHAPLPIELSPAEVGPERPPTSTWAERHFQTPEHTYPSLGSSHHCPPLDTPPALVSPEGSAVNRPGQTCWSCETTEQTQHEHKGRSSWVNAALWDAVHP